MIILGCFITGILFISFIIPLLEQILSIFSSFCEFIIYKYAFKIYKIKKQMGLNEEEEEEEQQRIIGFEVDPVINYEEEEYEQY